MRDARFPVAAPRSRARFPRLAAAWAILAAAPLAHADTTPPKTIEPGARQPEGDKPPAPPHPPRLAGHVSRVVPPDAPDKKKPTVCVLHPHDPHEACTPIKVKP